MESTFRQRTSYAAVRARRTAEAVAKAARYAGEILLDRRLYIASPPGIFAVLRTVRQTKAGTVMIVGHNPGLEAPGRSSLMKLFDRAGPSRYSGAPNACHRRLAFA